MTKKTYDVPSDCAHSTWEARRENPENKNVFYYGIGGKLTPMEQDDSNHFVNQVNIRHLHSNGCLSSFILHYNELKHGDDLKSMKEVDFDENGKPLPGHKFLVSREFWYFMQNSFYQYSLKNRFVNRFEKEHSCDRFSIAVYHGHGNRYWIHIDDDQEGCFIFLVGWRQYLDAMKRYTFLVSGDLTNEGDDWE